MASLNAYSPDYAVSPGSVLDEHRESAGLTQAELAQRLGFSTKHINRLIAGQEPVTPETALKLEAVFGLPAHVWLNLDARYREFQARIAEQHALEAELPWLDRLPWRGMRKLGWIAPALRGTALVRELRGFFGVGSLDYLPAVWSDLQAAYRKSAAFQSHEWALLAWLAHGEREAERIACGPFDAAALRAGLPDIKALSRLPGAQFAVPLVEQCARAGVAVVFLPAPDGARVCGATRWLSKDKVLVQLSLRYRTDDQLWFTLFHELGHVLLHGKREQFIDFGSSQEVSEAEREADEFAARSLVAPADLNRFIADARFTRSAVEQFAASQRVSPGIVIGQLQHRKVLPYNSALNKLKASFRWAHESTAA